MDQQIEKIHREDQKAVKIFRVNLLVLGVIVSGLTVLIQTEVISAIEFFNVHTFLGLFSLFLSTMVSAMAYTSSSFEMGASPTVIEEAVVMENGAFFEKLSEEYSTWVGNNQRVHQFNSQAIIWALMFALAGIAFFIGGSYIGITELRGAVRSYMLLIAEFIFIILVGLSVYYSDGIFERIMDMGG